MSRKIRFEPEANADLRRLVDFLDVLSPTAASRAASVIRQGINDLKQFPDSGSLIADRVRQKSIRFGDSGYVVQYRVDPVHIVIARVFHMREDR